MYPYGIFKMHKMYQEWNIMQGWITVKWEASEENPLGCSCFSLFCELSFTVFKTRDLFCFQLQKEMVSPRVLPKDLKNLRAKMLPAVAFFFFCCDLWAAASFVSLYTFKVRPAANNTSSSCLSDQLDVFEAAERYQKEGTPLIILAGKDYGSGNSRDWVAKGPYLLVNCSTHTSHFILTKWHNSQQVTVPFHWI